jgi:retinol dehydrogenase-12
VRGQAHKSKIKSRNIYLGGNTGIGYEIVKVGICPSVQVFLYLQLDLQQLLKKDAKVYVAARDKVKTQTAIERLQKETGKLGQFLQLDLADLDSVRASAEEFKR